ncbi:MAG: protein kinase [bacterium]|nr:protein kinase [bacterium]
MENLTGKVLKSYVLQDLIGAGGFGAVYQAHQQVVERDVAIKIIWSVFANHPNFIRRFEAEAQLIAGLEHPHIVPLYDYWREPDGAYLVMRFLRGGHLRQAMQDGVWSVPDTLQMLSQIASALMLAHRVGVVHRDIKPENILLDEDRNVYLADFGIAKILSNVHAQDGDEFAAFGSPAYAAPEQVGGKQTTPRADIYSLGIVLYEMLAGTHPFPDLATLSLTQLTTQRINETIPPIRDIRPDLSERLEQVLMKTTALDPEDRFEDVLQLVHAFRDAAYSTTTTSIGGRREAFAARVDTTELNRLSDEIPNPYKGLRTFQEMDAANFFGREALIRQLLSALNRTRQQSRFVAVVGPSGSGKSSVVKAGLIPMLRRGHIIGSDRWYYVEMVPGAEPFKELTAALVSVAATPADNWLERLQTDQRALLDIVNDILPPGTSNELFLFIDQFEEVFTLNDNEAEIVRFLETLNTALNEPNSRLRVVITLRADFYDRPLMYPIMSDFMKKNTEVVTPLLPDELERTIVGPARQVGVQLEEGLVSDIIAEVNQQVGALPLLQYLLSELFERREGTLMTMNAYRAIGGVRGALTKRADEIYQAFNADEQHAARQLFLRLITLGEGTEDTRRRALLSEITSMAQNNAAMRTVIDTMGKSRLLTFDRDPITRSPTVEVTHEAIIREWRRLREWLDASRSDVRMERTLAALAEEWMKSNYDISFLMRGARLEQYEKWVELTDVALTEQERAYLQAGIAEREARITQERESKARVEMLERRSRSRLRTLVVVLGIATVIAVGLTLFALVQSQLAQFERDQADAARSTSEANAALSQSLALETSARQALSEYNVDLAVTLAMLAANVPNPSPQAQRTLSEVAFDPGTNRVLGDYASVVNDVAISPDGQTLIAASFDSTVRLWDRATGQEIRRFTGHFGDVQSVSFNRDASLAVSTALDRLGIIWNVATGEVLHRLEGHLDPVRAAVFSPDGRYVVTGSSDATLIVWDVATGAAVRTLTGNPNSVLSVSISPDSRYVLSGAEDGRVILWDIETGQALRDLAGHTTSVLDVAFSPDSTRAITGSRDNSILVWDVETGALVRRLQEQTSVSSVAFTPDGLILSGTEDGILHVWDAETGIEITRLRGHTAAIRGISVSADGVYAATSSLDSTLRVWTLRDQRQLSLAGHAARIVDEAFTPDGRLVLTAGLDNAVRVWDTATGAPLPAIQITEGDVRAMSNLIIDNHVLIGLNDGRIIRHPVDGSAPDQIFDMGVEGIRAIAVSTDGTAFVAGFQDGSLIYADAQTGAVRQRINGHEGSVFSVDISPDGTRLVSGGRDANVLIWNPETGELVQTLTGHTNSVFSVDFGADGSRVISGGRDGVIILWDTATGTEIRRFLGHTDAVWSVRFTPDDQRLLSGSVDQYVILWDANTGRELERFDDLGAAVYRVAVDPTGTRVIVGQEGGGTSLWRLFSLPELIAWTQENRYIRELTCVERELYRVGGGDCQPAT